MKTILVIGAGKSSTCLIDYLLNTCALLNWRLLVADGNLSLAASKTGGSPYAEPVFLNVENQSDREILIARADIVISLLPASLHFLVARDCVQFRKDLLTASYIDDGVRSLEKNIQDNDLLFLCEMGLDPGIDHMSAMQIVDGIRKEEGRITSFRSHCGGLVAPESDDNPWHYKISWNPRNIVLAGTAGAVFKEKGVVRSLDYQQLFSDCGQTDIPGYGKLAFYPNRDSLGYIPVYQLEEADTFVRTTLRHMDFCRSWQVLVQAGLTDDKTLIDTDKLTFKKWSAPLLPFLNKDNERSLDFLGLFTDDYVPVTAKTSADILQYLIERNLPMKAYDKDMIVMLHEFEYVLKREKKILNSSLIVKGEDNVRTAMAKTVGLPLGIAAKLILEKKITVKGLRIPIVPEIYEPVLKELALNGIHFKESKGNIV